MAGRKIKIQIATAASRQIHDAPTEATPGLSCLTPKTHPRPISPSALFFPHGEITMAAVVPPRGLAPNSSLPAKVPQIPPNQTYVDTLRCCRHAADSPQTLRHESPLRQDSEERSPNGTLFTIFHLRSRPRYRRYEDHEDARTSTHNISRHTSGHTGYALIRRLRVPRPSSGTIPGYT